MSGLRVVSTLALFQGCGVGSELLLEQVQHDFSFRSKYEISGRLIFVEQSVQVANQSSFTPVNISSL